NHADTCNGGLNLGHFGRANRQSQTQGIGQSAALSARIPFGDRHALGRGEPTADHLFTQWA
ncbi:MAG: hypothetical protein EBU35_04945, partial [Marivivens sp.]|nr:hypothetical protein [Marivivens sp.]